MKNAAVSPTRSSVSRAATPLGSPSTDRIKLKGNVSRFPPIRKKSPQKKDSTIKCTPSGEYVELPKVASITFDTGPQTLDTGEEIEVLKCILVREGYLQRLVHASMDGKISGSHLSETVDLLDLLRMATLEVVETISLWRRKRNTLQEPYKWNNLNYLLKLASDLDFLEKHTGLVQWLGFTLVRNPFVLPMNLDCRARLLSRAAGRNNSLQYPQEENRSLNLEDSSAFVQIGGKRRLESAGDRPLSSAKKSAAAALAERKRAKNPYETRVINDEELVPLTPASQTRSNVAADKTFNRPKSRAQDQTDLVIPSQIGDLDMSRILDAEVIILQEESTFGRYTRDIQGRLVPEEEAKRRSNMVEMSGRPLHSYLDTSNVREEHRRPNVPNGVENGTTKPPPIPGRLHVKKQAGMLGPISKPSRKPIRQPPRRRSRGAQFEEALQHEKELNIQFGLLVDSLREEIERKEMDVAYFESFPGIQFYKGELQEFSMNAQQEIKALRMELKEKEYIYAAKTNNIHRKEEIIHIFKESHKTATETSRVERIHNTTVSAIVSNHKPIEVSIQHPSQSTNQEKDDAQVDLAHASPIVHHFCSTLIQKMVRGMLARSRFDALKIEYFVSSTYIQAVIRGFLVRRRVAKMYWENAATVILQRHTRGMIARRLVREMRRKLLIERNALTIQKVVRGHFGRLRMKKIRVLLAARTNVIQSIQDLQAHDLKELAAACLKMVPIPSLNHEGLTKPLTPLVLGIVRVLMLFTSDYDDAVDIPNVRWKEAAGFLQCSVRVLRQMKKIAVAAKGRYLRYSMFGNALLDAYAADLAFNVDTFARLECGWRAGGAIFQWVMAVATITRLQEVLPAYSVMANGPFLLAEATDAREATQDEIEQQENAIHTENIERRFVPEELLRAPGYPHHRPRPVLLVFAHDVPEPSKCVILERIMALLPGLFIIMNQRSPADHHRWHKKDDTISFDFRAIAAAVALGYNIILESDIGLTDPLQRQFLSAFAAVKSAIRPTPLCILVKGYVRNRTVVSTETTRFTEELQQQDTRHDNYSTRKLQSSEDREVTTSSNIRSDHRSMGDGTLKAALETAAQHLHALTHDSQSTAEMIELSRNDNPSTAFIVVMEAVIILLTPSKRYEGPKPTTINVSWKLGKRLLANPAFFHRKLYDVRHGELTCDNLVALDRYLKHKDWPSRTISHALGQKGAILHSLASWVQAMVTCAHIIMDAQGLAPEITRTTPVHGLFGNVITLRNTAEAHGLNRLGLEQQRYGEDVVVLELLEAILSDVRVYRTAHILDDRRCIVNVYHDCLHIYFSAYDPTSCWRWQCIVAETQVDALLAPNSLERGNVRRPPQTKAELYDRLVRLCLLQGQRERREVQENNVTPTEARSAAITSSFLPFQLKLNLRPRIIRLYRRTIVLCGYFTTITMSELSRGHIQIDAFVHTAGFGREVRVLVNIESILERMDAEEAQNMFLPSPAVPLVVLNRLHLFRVSPSHARGTDMKMKLRMWAGGSSRGRRLMRKSMRIPGLESVWICSLYQDHAHGTYQIEFYQPQTSEMCSTTLYSADMEQFICLSKSPTHQSMKTLLKHFRFTLDEESRRITTCTIRRALTKFPLAIPFASNPHHSVTKRQVIRAFVQVERQYRHEQPSISTSNIIINADPTAIKRQEILQYRISLPQTCEEYTVTLHESEVESCFSLSWIHASMSQRKHLSRQLAKMSFTWQEYPLETGEGKVVAHLPCGTFESILSTPNIGKKKTRLPPQTGSRLKRSPFTAHASPGGFLIATSCIRLLDTNTITKPHETHCYTYDLDEAIHKGSYRANGHLVIVQVFMKVMIVNTFVPCTPVDLVQQEDSFCLTFKLYHPKSSAGTSVCINGRRELREVVGPDKAALISSSSVDELIQHIIETRTEVLVPLYNSDQWRRNELQVHFLRDRLYTKQKVTPIHATVQTDETVNAVKLIDRAPERGVKVLSKTKSFADYGRVILTVFDVGYTRQRESAGKSIEDICIRVDAYVCSSGMCLSLILEMIDLVHVVGEDPELLKLLSTRDSSIQRNDEHRRKLAEMIVKQIGIEADGEKGHMHHRLFLTDYFAPGVEDSNGDDTTKQRRGDEILLFKTVRAVSHDRVVISVYLQSDLSLTIRFYEPRSSARQELKISKTAMSLILGLDEEEILTQNLLTAPPIPKTALVTHICSFIHLEMRMCQTKAEVMVGKNGETELLIGTLEYDMEAARVCLDRLQQHDGEGNQDTLSVRTRRSQASWKGMKMGRKGQYLTVHLELIHADNNTDECPQERLSASESVAFPQVELCCSVFSPCTLFIGTKHFSSLALATFLQKSVGSETFTSPAELLECIRDRLELDVTLIEQDESSGHRSYKFNAALN